MGAADMAALRSRGRQEAEQRFGLTFKRVGSSWRCRCPVHDGKSDDSFAFSEESGRFKCFSRPGCFSGDIFDLIEKMSGQTFKETMNGTNTAPQGPAKAPHIRAVPRKEAPALVVPTGTPEPDMGSACARWHYHDGGGGLLVLVDRIDEGGDKKRFLPWRWNGTEWEAKALPTPRPLYGLHDLALRPDAPVIVVEGEKTCDAARKLFPDYIVVTSSGGAGNARHSDWTPLNGRSVVIWPDNDGPGRDYAISVAALLTGIAASVRIVAVPEDWPEKWDLADDRPPSYKPGDGTRLLAEAKPFEATAEEWPEPEPIEYVRTKIERYPVEALGSGSEAAVWALVDGVEAAEAMAANVVLSGINAAVHAHADVETLSGRGTFLSVPVLTAAQSGDRKSECEYWVFRHAREIEKQRRDIAREMFMDWKAGAKQRHKDGEVTAPPPTANLFVADFTTEGLYRLMGNNHPAVCILTAEGGRLTGGHAMSEDNLRKTMACITDFIDKGVLEKHRAGNEEGDPGRHDGKRGCMHLLIQPEGARAFLTHPVVVDQGFTSRVLAAAPPRPLRTGRAKMTGKSLEAITAFSEAVARGVGSLLPTAPDDPLRITPPYLRLSPEADEVLRDYAAEMEGRMNPDGDLEMLQRYVNKSAEIATRLAACLYLFEGGKAPGHLPGQYAVRGVTLARWYVNEQIRVIGAYAADPELAKSWKLLRLVVGRRHVTITASQIADWKLVDFPTVAVVLEHLHRLVRGDWLRKQTPPKTGKPGRPWAAIFDIRPDAAELINACRIPSEQHEKRRNNPDEDNCSDVKPIVPKVSDVRVATAPPLATEPQQAPAPNPMAEFCKAEKGLWNGTKAPAGPVGNSPAKPTRELL